MVDKYKIKRIDANSLEDLSVLYGIVHKKKYPLEVFQKKFNTKVFGAEYIGYMAYYNEEAVACYMVFPCLMKYKGQTILAAQSGDTMTAQLHRGQGLFKMLAKKTFELAKTQGVKLIFGFPNSQSYHGFIQSLTWAHLENMSLYKMKVITLPVASVCKKSKALAHFYDKYINNILKLYKITNSEFEHSVNKEDTLHINYNLDYMNYKTYGGNFTVDINNTKCWVKINGDLVIGDMEITSDAETKKTLKRLKKFAFITGCRQVILSFSRGEYWDKELQKHLVREEGFPVACLNLGVNIPLQKLAFSMADLDSF